MLTYIPQFIRTISGFGDYSPVPYKNTTNRDLTRCQGFLRLVFVWDL